MITLKELAAKCGVSIATVSNILNGKGNVSEDTRKRILEIIKETGYRPNYMARGLRAAKTKTIGVIADDFTAFSSPMLIEGIMDYCQEHDYKIIFENLRLYYRCKDSVDDPKEIVKYVYEAVEEMLTIKVDGIIYVAAHSRAIDYIPKDLKIPLVLAYSTSQDNSISFVQIDDIASSHEITEYLLNKNLSKMAIVAGKEQSLHTIDRIMGVKKAFEEKNLTFDEDLLVYGKWDRQSGYESCKKLFAKNKKIDVIYCFNDLMAVGVYDYCKENNIEIGKDIFVAGFDNREISPFLHPSLTTMEIPLLDIGRKSAMILVNKINGTKDVNELRLPCRLIKRQSV